jgi:hypothetical protein
MELETSPNPLEDFVLLPGLPRRWEIPQVVKPDSEFRIEEAGELADHTPLFAVYRRDSPATSDTELSVPVVLSFEDAQLTVRARLLPIAAEPLMAVVVLGDHPDDSNALAQIRDHLARSTHGARGGTRGPREPKVQRQEGTP